MHLTLRATLAGALAVAALVGPRALAADHNEASGAVADHVADIDDVYAWHTADGKLVAIVTFGGPGGEAVAPPADFDADLLYAIQLDNDGDFVADQTVWVRFGQDATGAWGVQFEGIPGGSGTVSGPVGAAIDAGNGLQAMAGVFDDPFFFDVTGLTDTLATATVSFQSTRDGFAGRNVNAIVVQMDTAAATASSNVVRLWATSSRK
ncbi:MAG: DUF4331 family protein [Myxococcota bacterium]